MITDYFVKSIMTAEEYDRAAQEYQAGLPLEHFMEATPQATQREITVASLALLRKRRGGLGYFNELLVQYFYKGNLRQVVPDNMLVNGVLEDRDRTNFAVELEPEPPFWMLEYVSASSTRKDYKDSFRKYERELHTPYYLVFDPEKQDLRLYRHEADHYALVGPNAEGRYPIAELEAEVGLLQGWVRYWYRGELLEIPVELEERILRLQEQLDQKDQQLQALLNRLRSLVQERAEHAGRQDILEKLPTTTDGMLLTQWLHELR